MSNKKGTKMSLSSFQNDETFGKVTNWAAETDQFLPTVPLSQRVPEHNTLHMVPIEHLQEQDIQSAFKGVKAVKFIKHFAYVEFSNAQDCIAALEKDGHVLRGQPLKISPAKEGLRDNQDDRNWGRSGWQQQSQPQRRQYQQQSEPAWDRSNWGQRPTQRPEQQDEFNSGSTWNKPRAGGQEERSGFGRPSNRPDGHHHEKGEHGGQNSTWGHQDQDQRPNFDRQRSFDNNDSRSHRPVSKADSVSSWRK